MTRIITNSELDGIISNIDEIDVKRSELTEERKKLVKRVNELVQTLGLSNEQQLYTRTHLIYKKFKYFDPINKKVTRVVRRRSDKEGLNNIIMKNSIVQ